LAKAMTLAVLTCWAPVLLGIRPGTSAFFACAGAIPPE
jgi:hypothetical protein